MWQKWLREYFSFTAGERTAVMILLALILLITVLPYVVPVKREQIDPAALAEFQREIAVLKPVAADKDTYHREERREFPSRSNTRYTPPAKAVTLFYFDPNTLPEEGWIKLGIAPRTAQTIRHYCEKGGKFRHPEDLGKIYSLHEADLARLLPYVRLPSPPAQLPATRSSPPQTFMRAAPKNIYIDLNQADSAALEALPGIGPRLAVRILNFRDRLGGFYSVDQVAETFGLPDSTFQTIRDHLHVNPGQVKTLNINQLPADQLQQHPYLRWALANVIVRYRQQHGNFTSKEELLQIDAITPELFKKITPYMSIE